MNYQEEYQRKLGTIEETAKQINGDDIVYVAGSISTPYRLVDAVVDRKEEVKGLHTVGILFLGQSKLFTTPGVGDYIHHETFFYGGTDRIGRKNGVVEVNSVHLSNSGYALEHVMKVNTLMVSVAPMDEEGYFDHGPFGSWNGQVQGYAKKIILSVNENMPRTRGKYTKIHISEVDYLCESLEPLAELSQPEVTDNDRAVADWILPEIHDGACLQIGLGGLANAIGYGLEKKKNLSVHTEMLTDSIVHLVKTGAINGKIYAGFCLGSESTYRFPSEDERVEMGPIPLINQVNAIAANDNFVSINSCLEADLTGQVASESMGYTQFSSTGGQLDFVRGAAKSKGGKSFLCMASTYTDKAGKLQSKISLSLPPGAAVTTPRADAMFIVTEYGIADVYCKSLSKRVEAMLSIAHPDFREELRQGAIDAGLLMV